MEQPPKYFHVPLRLLVMLSAIDYDSVVVIDAVVDAVQEIAIAVLKFVGAHLPVATTHVEALAMMAHATPVPHAKQ